MRALDGGKIVVPQRNENFHVGWKNPPGRAAADNHTADDPIFRPQDDDVNRLELFSCLDVAENLRQYQALHGKECRVRNLNVLHQLRFHWNGWKTFLEFRTMPNGHHAPQLNAVLFQRSEEHTPE